MTSLAETRIRSLKEAETPTTKEPIRDLIHELRQPLSSIEAIAYYLEMTLPANQTQPRRYMRELQQLVDETNTMLKEAAGRLN
jgi:nitrogen-specific signal transduction histidine kinase